MQKILSPILPGQARLEIIKHGSGGFVVRLGSEAGLLSPRATYDFAVSLLKNLGVEVAETHKRPDDFAGDVLKANIKLVG